jgi:hypothetical protein
VIRTRTVVGAFVAFFAIAPVAFVLAISTGDEPAGHLAANTIFFVGLGLELAAFGGALAARRHFDSGDAWHTIWTLAAAFLGVRILAELRLATLVLEVVPYYYEGAPAWLFVYVVVFRYLYTVADLLFLAALVLAIRSYRSSGFGFTIAPRDYLYMAPLVVAVGIAFWLRHLLTINGDAYLQAYRLVAMTLNMAMACLCIVIRRFTVQMGGGALARVWTYVVFAATARVSAFVSVAVVARLLPSEAGVATDFVEQYLIAVFAACWVAATLAQHDVRRHAEGDASSSRFR